MRTINDETLIFEEKDIASGYIDRVSINDITLGHFPISNQKVYRSNLVIYKLNDKTYKILKNRGGFSHITIRNFNFEEFLYLYPNPFITYYMLRFNLDDKVFWFNK